MTKLFLFGVMLLAGWFGHSPPTQAQTCDPNILASTPTKDFIDHGDGTVTHKKTGLMWAKCPVGQSGADCATGSYTGLTNWPGGEADTAAANSRLGGYSDWRVPTLDELKSLLEAQCFSPKINTTLFPSTPLQSFWTSTSFAANSRGAWIVNFVSGHVNGHPRGNYGYAPALRAVRAG